MTPLKKAALICRVSSDKQDFERQTADLRTLVASMGFTIESDEDIYAEKISGTLKADDRPEMVRLKKNVATGAKKYDMVFCQEVSRIGRHPGDAKNTIEFLADQGVPVYVQNLSQCSVKPDGSRNEIFHMIYSVMAELAKTENDIRAMRSKSGTAHKVRQGHAGCGLYQAYGYTKDDKKNLIIHPEEAEVIKSIFSMILEGLGTKQIAHILNQQGVPTKTQKLVKKGKLKMKKSNVYKDLSDVKWVDGALHGILRNPIYKGLRIWKGEEIPLPQLQIIDPETWEKVQEVRRERFDTRVRDTRWIYLFHGLLKCGTCGRNMYGRYKAGGKDCYYQCSSVRDKGCGNGGINIEVLESCVWELISTSGQVFDYFRNSGTILGKTDEDLRRAKVDLDIEKKKHTDLVEEMERLNFMFQKKKIKASAWESETERVEKDIVRTNREIASLKQKIKELAESQLRLSNMDEYFKVVVSGEYNRLSMQKMFQNIIDKIIITAVKQNTKNQDRHIVSVFIKDLWPPLTILTKSKPRHIPEDKWVIANTHRLTDHSRCIFYTANAVVKNLIQYNERNQLVDPKPWVYPETPIVYRSNSTTAIDKVVDLILKVHPELYFRGLLDPEEIAAYHNNSDVEPRVPLRLIQMEEVNRLTLQEE